LKNERAKALINNILIAIPDLKVGAIDFQKISKRNVKHIATV